MSGVTATTSTAAAATGKGTQTSTNQLGKDDFLKLLITQLRFQDPLKPMEDKEFIAEMAQFNSLEEMQQLNKNMAAQATFTQLTQASSLIGKSVTVKDGDSSSINGTVTEVRFVDSVLKVMVQKDMEAGDTPFPAQPYPLDAITKVGAYF